MVTFLPNYLESIKEQDISIVDVLYKLTEEEIIYRDERASKIQVTVAAFPFEKEIKDFDFSYQPGINKQQILDLETLRFMENKENILFVGSSGVGKTHLAISLGIAAAKKRYLTYFISCHDLIMQLKKAHAENRLEQRLKQFCKYRLLIIDEIGYLPVDRDGANLFFQLIAKRYEESSTGLSLFGVGEWVGGWWCWSGSLGVWIPRRCSPPPCNCLTRGGCRVFLFNCLLRF